MDNEALVLDFLGWLAERPRAYDEVLVAWRSTCPRLTIWEDCVDAGLVRHDADGRATTVRATDQGLALLRASGRADAPSQ